MGSTSPGQAEGSCGPSARALLAMAAPKKPLEFHAKRPWGREVAVEDPDEDDEDDNVEDENGFSLEEVLRLGGTKVMTSESWRREARGVVPRGAGPGPGRLRAAAGEGLRDADPSFGRCSVRFPLFFSTALYKRKAVYNWTFLSCGPSWDVGDPLLLFTWCSAAFRQSAQRGLTVFGPELVESVF